jgi:hypothetical protein
MNVSKKYVIYRLNNVMGSEEHKALEKVNLSGWKQNSFDSEDEAIQALIDDEQTYQDFVILREVYITNH